MSLDAKLLGIQPDAPKATPRLSVALHEGVIQELIVCRGVLRPAIAFQGMKDILAVHVRHTLDHQDDTHNNLPIPRPDLESENAGARNEATDAGVPYV
jgi:hypothetical protein